MPIQRQLNIVVAEGHVVNGKSTNGADVGGTEFGWLNNDIEVVFPEDDG